MIPMMINDDDWWWLMMTDGDWWWLMMIIVDYWWWILINPTYHGLQLYLLRGGGANFRDESWNYKSCSCLSLVKGFGCHTKESFERNTKDTRMGPCSSRSSQQLFPELLMESSTRTHRCWIGPSIWCKWREETWETIAQNPWWHALRILSILQVYL